MPQNVQMFLVSTTGQTEAQQLGDGGQFEFRNIMPGTYVAQIVDCRRLRGDEHPPESHTRIIGSPIVVSDADVTGLQLAAGGRWVGERKSAHGGGRASGLGEFECGLVRVVEARNCRRWRTSGRSAGQRN